MHTTIERELELQLVLTPARAIPVPARLAYHSGDPYAVHITFHIGSDVPVNWVFARDLLVDGAFRPTGDGDVRVWPATAEGRRVICLSLRSPDGEALLRAPATPLTAWVERILRLVPPGTEAERMDLSGGLCALLSAGPGEEAGGTAPAP
ncbi:SsgA family sporulation/cell division regulator [Streptomyces hoynatensis]|uniref:SsgA family sporulation/cell division regulator n=1 Tax=Streptomyces hoynatensis TaxID=1141874 RepID=A0A3A9YUJ7_9ACTN|nr:SsgA family sporulation/cell division regulator [Streptomyces hoynatensis]RKN39791.1 SsgA family sporulation/cell division regulator [Streptomyces hoynatensis]